MTITNNYPMMTRLAATFPTLQDAPIEPFNPEALDDWACGPAPSSGGRYAARFILAVFSGQFGRCTNVKRDKDEMFIRTVETAWGCGLFDVVDAMSTWDDSHRLAFLDWAENPWWP